MWNAIEALSFAANSEDYRELVAIVGNASLLVDWEVHLYSATHEFITRDTPLDTPPAVMFKGALEKAFHIDRSIISGDRVGEEVTIGLGEMRLTNYEGDYDALAIAHTSLGQKFQIKIGDRTRPYSEWVIVLSGHSVSQTVDRDSIVFSVRDRGYLLDVPASPNVYGGTGGEDGGDDLKGKRKQRVFGHVLNVSAPLVISTSLAYQVNDGRVHAIDAVYVRGVAMVAAGDYATVSAMNGAMLSVGYFATCLEACWFRIAVASDSEIGQVTCDVRGDKAGLPPGVFAETTGAVVRRLLTSDGTSLVDSGDLVVPSFDALDDEQPAPVGYVVPDGSDETVRQSVGRLMAGIGGWCGVRRTGKFEVRRFDEPSGNPVAEYQRYNIVDITSGTLPDYLVPPPFRVLVAHSRNWTVQTTDLAGSVSDARRAFLAEDVRYESAEDLATAINFPPGHEYTVDYSFFRDSADALAEAQRKLALFGTARDIFAVKIAERITIHELGQVVSIQDTRFGLDDGRLGRIVKLVEDDVDGVEITVFT